jgi:hypothetical protein
VCFLHIGHFVIDLIRFSEHNQKILRQPFRKRAVGIGKTDWDRFLFPKSGRDVYARVKNINDCIIGTTMHWTEQHKWIYRVTTKSCYLFEGLYFGNAKGSGNYN